MPDLLLYLLKANVALVLFYLAYLLVLRKLTFYHLNRLYLVFGIVFSAAYPFVDLTELFSRHQELAAMQSYAVVLPTWSAGAIPEQAAPFDYWLIPVGLFWAGCAIMGIKLLLQFVSLYRIHRASVPASYQDVDYRKVAGINEAFSFWRNIYVNPDQHRSPELESILRHEQIHVNGWHTLDVLLAELSTMLYWFNPGVWLMKKALKENLEFIADQHVVDAGVDRKEYQYLLLKVVGATQPQIANQFNFPSLKRRITMMNKMPTHRASKLRLLIALPLSAVLLLAFRGAASEIEVIAHPADTELHQQNDDKTLPKELVEHLKKDPAIKNVHSRVIDGKHAVVINLKGGGTEVYYLNDDASVAKLQHKYGLPTPPPPPAAPNTTELPAPPPPPAPAQELTNSTASLPDGVVYYIDGKKDTDGSYKNIAPAQIYSINVYKGEYAVKVFGKSAANGVVSIITERNKDTRQVQEFMKKMSALPPPPAPAKEQLPPPPPPKKYEGPAIPKAGGPRLVENEEYVVYTLWPEEITKRELEVAQQVFRESGFSFEFEENYENGKINGVRLNLNSKAGQSSAEASYSPKDIQNLLAADNIVLVQANKKTGKVGISHTLAQR